MHGFWNWMVSVLLLSNAASGTTNTTRKTLPLDYEDKLIDYLFDGYKKSIRPGVLRDGRKEPVQVRTTFAVYRVLGSDDRLETISIIAYVIQWWFDQRLGWNPNDYGNLTTIGLDWQQVWTPQLIMSNMGSLNTDDTSYKARIILNQTSETAGYLAYFTYAAVQERCAFDMTYFPFDHQRCLICGSGSEQDSDVHYTTTDPLQYMFEKGGEWELVSLTNATAPQRVCFAITIQRRPVYYVVNLLLPTIIICVLNTIGLFASIHTASEEMEFSSLGQTTLLSLGVLMLTVADQTPKGANHISLLGIFFLAMICQTLLASLTAIIWKKQLRIFKNASSRWSHQPASAIKFDKYHFLKCHGTKICMALHLTLITCITATVLAMGYSNVRTPMKME